MIKDTEDKCKECSQYKECGGNEEGMCIEWNKLK